VGCVWVAIITDRMCSTNTKQLREDSVEILNIQKSAHDSSSTLWLIKTAQV